MPKELVESCDGGPWQSVVGWGPDGVQAATVAEGERSIYWLLLASEHNHLTYLGAEVRELAMLPTDEERGEALLNMLDARGYATGLWAQLDRAGCNRLIRLLRKARDASFGRDE